MRECHQVNLPTGICADLNSEEIETMIKVAFSLEPLWENALGSSWRKKISDQDLFELYRKM